MKLTIADCIALIQARLTVLSINNEIQTVEFWSELEEIVQQGKERAHDLELGR